MLLHLRRFPFDTFSSILRMMQSNLRGWLYLFTWKWKESRSLNHGSWIWKYFQWSTKFLLRRWKWWWSKRHWEWDILGWCSRYLSNRFHTWYDSLWFSGFLCFVIWFYNDDSNSSPLEFTFSIASRNKTCVYINAHGRHFLVVPIMESQQHTVTFPTFLPNSNDTRIPNTVKSIKPGGLRLFLMFYLMGMQNTPDRMSWRANQPSSDDYVVEMFYHDASAMMTIELTEDEIRITRCGSLPSTAYLMQESVIVQYVQSFFPLFLLPPPIPPSLALLSTNWD